MVLSDTLSCKSRNIFEAKSQIILRSDQHMCSFSVKLLSSRMKITQLYEESYAMYELLNEPKTKRKKISVSQKSKVSQSQQQKFQNSFELSVNNSFGNFGNK